MSSTINANNNAKGIELEELFCDYMRKELGYHKARTRAQVVSDFNSRGINVDVIAEVRNKRYEYMKIVSIILYAVFVAYTLLVLFLAGDSTVPSEYVYGFWVFSVLACIFATILLVRYQDNIIQHGWAECKNQQESISTELMQLAIVRFNSYQNTKNKEYIFTNLYFVCTGSFSEGALKLAQDKNVKCYKLECGNFVEVTYW
ncbi:hypothetical protein CJD36_010920 [Flavipsychrobacter stenotrophus]|uniref:Uncharacterized protein n=1 Tax=Flavipsychrobacter stenotrophus TaxID=2077091 RepID=A0A2S7SU86_9BACT|nr:hypothetical protein CJD36_010920 [Flavipsychrobacter stenotrophus]